MLLFGHGPRYSPSYATCWSSFHRPNPTGPLYSTESQILAFVVFLLIYGSYVDSFHRAFS
jgi:hypothetical protein